MAAAQRLDIDIGYVGNLGRHEVVPLPFNQAKIASPTNPLRAGSASEQDYTYGYSILTDPATFTPATLPNGQPYLQTYEGGNVDLRVPYIGYSSESESYTAAGISAYNALQTHIEKRMSHGLQVGASYTYSHAHDEQSAMGLFYNGNNPQDLRSGYGLSDFDRTHVINFTYTYELPKFFALTSLKGKIADGWAFPGLTVIQSGQPYSVVDYSGAVGSIYLWRQRRHHESHRSAGGLFSQASDHRGDWCGQTPALNSGCFGIAFAGARSFERRYSVQ